MPRELKKRGRREEKKRKTLGVDDEGAPKRQRLDNAEPEDESHSVLEVQGNAGDDFISFNAITDNAGPQQQYYGSNENDGDVNGLYNDNFSGDPTGPPQQETQFYGLLDEEEQSYYANVNNKLSANDFESDEDRNLFIEAVHRETQGKELKVASSQSCSRYLEKIILLSTAAQLKSLFTAFLENLTYLVQHRFGSHCCEALFLQAAKFVAVDEKVKDPEVSMEALFLQAGEQLKPNMGFLVTERFATHTIRVLLLVLSGEPLDEASLKVVASKRKEKLDVPASAQAKENAVRKVPASFTAAVTEIIASAVLTLDTTYIRALATHPTGNPFLQLCLRLELQGSGKAKDKTRQNLYMKLFPDEDLEAESDSGKFIQGLIYDPTGSHLVEVLIQHLPGKLFKKLYGNILKEKMGNMARNDIASYIAIRVIERLGKDDLLEVQKQIIPEVQTLVSRLRFNVIQTLFERLAVRNADSTPLSEALKNAYDGDVVTIFPKMLQFNTSVEHLSAEATSSTVSPARADLHGSLLAQAILRTPGACEMLQQSLLEQPIPTLMLMAKNNIASRAIQAALASETSGVKFKKQFVPKFQGELTELAQDAAGSHVVDVLWKATDGLHFMKEKLAQELAHNESALRESVYGRTVWRNWAMDTFQRRPREWQAIAKGYDQEDHSKPQQQQGEQPDAAPKKSAIQLARERHAKKSTSKVESEGSLGVQRRVVA